MVHLMYIYNWEVVFLEEKELWKPILGYSNYEVSNLGRVRSITRKVKTRGNGTRTVKSKILLQDTTGRYHMVTLYKNGVPKNVSVHRQVALAFIDNPDNKETVDHIDRNKDNNRASNLRWASRLEQEKNKTFPQREIYAIKDNRKMKYSGVNDCARRLGLSASKISACLRGRRNTHGGYHFCECNKK